jgi:hypothetical protein
MKGSIKNKHGVFLIIFGLIFSANLFSFVRGSGNIKEIYKTLGEFNSVVLQCSGNIFVLQGDNQKVKLETDDNIIPEIKTKIVDKILYIDAESSISPTKLNVYLIMKEIKGFKIEGSGNIVGGNTMKGKNVYFVIEGSGDIKFKDISATKIEAKITGTGDMKISGKTDVCNVQIDGSGDIDFENLVSSTTRIRINGSGDCKVNANDKLFGEINGNGDIFYKGTPTIKEVVTNGSGKVRPIK